MQNARLGRLEIPGMETKEAPCSVERVISALPHAFEPVSALAGFVQQARAARLRLRYVMSSPDQQPVITVALERSRKPGVLLPHASALRQELEMWTKFIWPGATFSERTAPLSMKTRFLIVPEAHDHWGNTSPAKTSPSLVGLPADWPLLEQTPWRQITLVPALGFLQAHAPAELIVTLSPYNADARCLRHLSALLKTAASRGDATLRDEARTGFLKNLSKSGTALRLEFEVALDDEAAPVIRDLVSYLIFGSAADADGFSETRTDFRCLWPLGNALPNLLVEPLLVETSHDFRPVAHEPGMLSLGRLEKSDLPLGLTARDRGRHIYMLGGTGTGKSTLLANMMRQDMRNGEGLVLIDPHGDLADDVRRLVPDHRKRDLVWCDFSAPETILGLNILEMTGLDPEIERSIIANQLTNLFKSILYRDVDAFGPMFDQYFRSGLMLLMCARGNEASLMDFERIFHDQAFRCKLLKSCADAKVREFWEDVAANVSDSADHSLANMTPYVTSKLAQLTGNPLVRRFISAKDSKLDIRDVMNSGKILLVKLAKGITGEYDTKLLATLLCMRIMQSGMSRATMAPEQRRPCRFYFDEFQNAHGQPIAAILAEARKYGISATLANQSLGQVTGRSGLDDAGDAALANAANLIVFRIGAVDAARIAPWLQPEINWHELMRLPDFRAVTRVLINGKPAPPQIVRTPSPPTP